jgi:SAM-dependent methyltransferase
MLAEHHRDGEAFAQLMEETCAGRFNDAFWQMWDEHIVPALPDSPVVVDLGTGPATFVKALVNKYPNVKAYGVECAPYMLQAVGELPANAEVIEADLQDPALPFAANSVDVAIASVVIHEMHQPVRMFRELYRILKPSALFYIYDWVRVPLQAYLKNADSDPFAIDVSVDELEDLFIHFIEHNRFSLEDLKFMLDKTGFRVLDDGFKNEGQHAWLLVEKPQE